MQCEPNLQERLQMKREPLDKWSIREQLCLASAVARSGDQNWMSVSRALKPFGEANRPADWFHQKNCAAQYGALLANVEMPKRKKRASGVEPIIEPPQENIFRRLHAERKAELKKLMAEEQAEYLKLQEELTLLQSGKVSEDQLDQWCKEIEEEESRKEQESLEYTKWLKEREIRKQEIERVWRPTKPAFPVPGQKRKNSDSLESMEIEQIEEHVATTPTQSTTPEIPKPALSPLLTSLLKSPSQVPQQNVATSSILHSVITNQRPTNTSTSPMIASLLNSSASVAVSPNLQLLVTSAIGNETSSETPPATISNNDILDDDNLKIDDLANSILEDGPLPEIKKEEVDDIISEIIENAHDIVTDPEQHLQLDGNGDIKLEMDDLEEEEESPPVEEPEIKETKEIKEPEVIPPVVKVVEKPPPPSVDPFEFQEDPVIFEPPKPAKNDAKQHIPQYQQALHSPVKEKVVEEEVVKPKTEEVKDEKLSTNTEVEEPVEKTSSPEVVETSEDSNKESTKSEEPTTSKAQEIKEEVIEEEPLKEVDVEDKSQESSSKSDNKEATEDSSSEAFVFNQKPLLEPKKEPINLDSSENNPPTTITPDFTEELYDDITMEVKIDKTGKFKRDYSRTKKKEEKPFDVFLAIEKSPIDEDCLEETSSDKEPEEKMELRSKVKLENDRSNSPWTEEEDFSSSGRKRRYSPPATPSDSVPNSPASSLTYEEDRDYKNWKKSAMLVYNRLATHKNASLFMKPITEDHAPGYNNLIYRPMDLQTIKKNIEGGGIRTTLEFKRDMLLMFANAILYNKTESTVYNMAKQMSQECLQEIAILENAQAVPTRRETRTSESSCKRKRTSTISEDAGKSKKRKED